MATVIECEQCGRLMPGHARYCGRCGAELMPTVSSGIGGVLVCGIVAMLVAGALALGRHVGVFPQQQMPAVPTVTPLEPNRVYYYDSVGDHFRIGRYYYPSR